MVLVRRQRHVRVIVNVFFATQVEPGFIRAQRSLLSDTNAPESKSISRHLFIRSTPRQTKAFRSRPQFWFYLLPKSSFRSNIALCRLVLALLKMQR